MLRHGFFKEGAVRNNGSYIYAALHASKAEEIITLERSDDCKTPWLIRESAIAGLLTITLFDATLNTPRHRRIYFEAGQWHAAPSEHNREKVNEVAARCQHIFQKNLSQDNAKTLAMYLQENGFTEENLIEPSPDLATQNPSYIDCNSGSLIEGYGSIIEPYT